LIASLKRLYLLYRLLWRERRIDTVEHLAEGLDQLKSASEVPVDWRDEWDAFRSRFAPPERPLVSVCVRTCDRPELLCGRSLPSILGQTYDRLQVIVVGDACGEETSRRLAQVRDSRLTYVNLEQRGPYPDDPLRRWMVMGWRPFNHALSLVEGDYVTHLDDDDEYLPERVERLVWCSRETGADFIWHPFWRECADGRWRVNEAREFVYGNLTTSSVFYNAWFRRVEWDRHADRFGEVGDYGVFRRIRYLGARLQRYPEPLIRHYREQTLIAPLLRTETAPAAAR
jgi:glycosyltransferase involved in cell wall biosynthesis